MSLSEHWPRKRLRFALTNTLTEVRRSILKRVEEVTFLPMEAIGEKGELDTTHVRNIDDVRTGYTLCFDGDVVVAKITPCFENGKGAVIRGTKNGLAYATTELIVLTPGAGLDSRFLYYITASSAFRRMGEAAMLGAAGQKRVTEDYARNVEISLPPLDQQRKIVDYLDVETARIDALIMAKERLLALLAERRQAVATHAVTRGVGPDAPMRDSGIAWIEVLPAHWEIERTRWLFRERDERSATGQEELLTVSHLTGVTPRAEKDVNMFEAETTEGYKVCRPGDLVINTLWAWMGAMGTAPVTGITSPAYNV